MDVVKLIRLCEEDFEADADQIHTAYHGQDNLDYNDDGDDDYRSGGG